MRRAVHGLVALLAILAIHPAVSGPARAQGLVADLSEHLVAITTGFTGKEVLLFGAVETPGDVVVTVIGPRSEAVVRRKERVLGVWANVDSQTFDNVPAFYWVSANRPLEELATPALLDREQIGERHLNIKPLGHLGREDGEIQVYREALLRNRAADGLYIERPNGVAFLGNRLFSARIFFPPNVPTGTYLVQVVQIVDGQVAAAQTTPLVISKVGVGSDIYTFAHSQSVLYGLVAIAVAVMSGWLAGFVFRKS